MKHRPNAKFITILNFDWDNLNGINHTIICFHFGKKVL